LACDALAFKPTVEVTDEEITGLDLANFELDYDLLESPPGSSSAFPEFVQGHEDDVFQSALIFQIQQLRHDLAPVMVCAESGTDDKARAPEVELLRSLKLTASRMHMTIGAFVTDGDSGYDLIHEKQNEINCRAFEQTQDAPRMQKYGSSSYD
jgi:hypothetical protein